MIDLTLMRVWDDPKKKYIYWVIQQFDNEGCIAVSSSTPHETQTREEALENVKYTAGSIIYWKHCTPIRKELSAVVRSAEEIIGIPGIKKFSIYIDDYTWLYYPGHEGKRIIIEKCSKYTSDYDYDYDYYGGGCFWLKNWLKNFKEDKK